MADDTTGTASQADPAAASQADTSTTDTAAQAAEAALAAKKRLDKEAIQLRRERDDALRRLKERDDAELSETERLKKELAEVKAKESTWAAERRVRDARDYVLEVVSAEKVDARNPRALYRLLKDDLEIDDKTGRVTNLDELLKSAKTEYPEQFGRSVGSGDGGAGSRQTGGAADINSLIRSMAGRG